MLSYPKSKQTKKPKRKTPKTKSICVECGEIWRGSQPEHEMSCEAWKVITFRKNKTDKQMYEAALDFICREITKWRDGVVCVINDGYCNDESHWGHVIPQGRSAYLVYELSNSFRQCAKHNELHRGVQYPYLNWYERKWGKLSLIMLEKERQERKGGRNAGELRDTLRFYVDMWKMRNLARTTEEKVSMGYYGGIIKEAWIKEGRI